MMDNQLIYSINYCLTALIVGEYSILIVLAHFDCRVFRQLIFSCQPKNLLWIIMYSKYSAMQNCVRCFMHITKPQNMLTEHALSSIKYHQIERQLAIPFISTLSSRIHFCSQKMPKIMPTSSGHALWRWNSRLSIDWSVFVILSLIGNHQVDSNSFISSIWKSSNQSTVLGLSSSAV